MKTFLFCLLTIFLLSGSKVAVNPEPVPQYDFSAVDKFIDQHADVYNNNVVVLVSHNGQLIYKKQIGLTPNAGRLIASASKWLSGAVIMALVDEHKLSLEDTVGKFLPLFSKYQKGHITIRQLFSHTSGFPGDSPDKFEYRRNLTLEQAVDSFAVYTDMIHNPGTTFNYGSVGMHIAGRIAEVVSGKKWQALFDEKIATPCNMRAKYLIMNPKNPLIAGGVRTSAEDYLHFLEMIVNKGKYDSKQVLSEKAVTEMLKDQTAGADIEGTPYPGNPFTSPPVVPVRYGIGNWLDVVDDAGNILESSSPGLFGTHPWQDSKNKIAGIIFTRTDPRKSNSTSLQVRQMIRKIVGE